MVRWVWIGGAQCNPILDLTGHDQGSLWFLIEVEDRGFLRHDSSDHLSASPKRAAKGAKMARRGKVDDYNVDTKKKGMMPKKSGSML